MNSTLDHVCQLAASATEDATTTADIANAGSQIASVAMDEVNHTLNRLVVGPMLSKPQRNAVQQVLSLLCAKLDPNQLSPNHQIDVETVLELYARFDETDPSCSYLLTLLAVEQSEPSIKALAELLSNSPPRSTHHVIPCVGILMRNPGVHAAKLFPIVLDGLQFRSVAGPVLDFANFLLRNQKLSEHPAIGRENQLTSLLGVFAGKLGEHEDTIQNQTNPTPEQAQIVADSISVVISLCDALALMNAKSAIGKIYQVLELSHRRLRTEAAAALARMGEEAGKLALIDMAQYPISRLRVLSYAEELGLFDEIAAEHKTAVARAESEFTLLLSEPTFFGFAPANCELIDQNSLYWPGFDEPVDCYLFRYTYPLDQGELQNIGIVGPLTHCIATNLNHLPPEDIYAAYAGWHVDHEEIYSIEIDPSNSMQQVEVQKRAAQIAGYGYESVQPVFIGVLFGERSLVAKASVQNRVGTVIFHGAEPEWFEGLVPETSYDIHVGRRLLRSFNE